MPRNLFKKISLKNSKKSLLKIISYLRKELEPIIKRKKIYKGVFKTLNNYPGSISNFINKYHHKPILWSNKLAYLAGLIDGEGYFKVEKQGTLRLIIGMCDKKTIQWIKDNFGGNITIQKTQKGRLFYVWRLNQGKDLFYLMLCIIPFLVNKKDIAVNFFKIIINKIRKMEHTLYPPSLIHKEDSNSIH